VTNYSNHRFKAIVMLLVLTYIHIDIFILLILNSNFYGDVVKLNLKVELKLDKLKFKLRVNVILYSLTDYDY